MQLKPSAENGFCPGTETRIEHSIGFEASAEPDETASGDTKLPVRRRLQARRGLVTFENQQNSEVASVAGR